MVPYASAQGSLGYYWSTVNSQLICIFVTPLCQSVKVMDMPVPSSYNDVTQEASIRDHIGWAWYQRTFIIPKSWKSQLVTIRFGSVNYHAVVVIAHVYNFYLTCKSRLTFQHSG